MNTPAIHVEDVHKRYRRDEAALNGVHLSIPRGAFFGLLGPNGAGKSTLIGLLASLVRLERGRIRLFGHDVVRDPVAARRQVGLVPQEVNFNSFEPTIEIIASQGMYYGLSRRRANARAREVLAQVGLSDRAHRKPWGLSGGMKRKLMLARALVHEPRLLILDEPTAGLDVGARQDTRELLTRLNKAGTTILMSSHYLEEIRDLCAEVAVLHKGRLIARDTPERLLNPGDSPGEHHNLDAGFLALLSRHDEQGGQQS